MRRALVVRLALLSCISVVLPHALDAQERDHYLERARALMRQVPLIDGHNDLPWNLRVRYGMSVDSFDISRRQSRGHTDIPRLREGLVGAQFWSTYTPSSFGRGEAARAGMEQGDVVHRMVRRYPETFEMAGTAADIVRIHRSGKIACLLGLEGGHMIENSLGLLRAFYRDGVRYMTLTHSDNTDWADSATDSLAHGGLTPFGEEVVREMNRLGMLVDISHVSDSTAWDVLRVTEAPVILSHSSSRHFAPHPRNLPDDLAAAVAANGGVIMVNFVLPFIYQPAYEWYGEREALVRTLRAAGVDAEAVRDSARSWMQANPRPRPDLGVVVDHMEHLREVAGADHIGIGSDFDGIDMPPEGLDDVSQFPNLVAEMLRRGWGDEDVMKVIGVNVLRVMQEAELVAQRLQRERPASTAQIEILDGWDSAPPLRRPYR
jgi:membrane dipeptidase